jgi:predicted nucleic acid-binding protein
MEEYKAAHSSKSCRKNHQTGSASGSNVRSTAEISPDPKDNPFCPFAEQGKADFIVTLNSEDFPEDRLKAKVIAPGPLRP